jgi:hypothetical protein
MNKYVAFARAHWERQRPMELAAMDNPDAFFSMVGMQIEEAIQRLTQQLAGPARPGEPTLPKLRRLRLARLDAESIVLRQYLDVAMSESDELLASQVRIADWPSEVDGEISPTGSTQSLTT